MADQEPPAVHQETSTNLSTTVSRSPDSSPDCPFCTITSHFPSVDPASDTSNTTSEWNPDKLTPPAYVLLSTEDVIAFLDIAPLTRGHVLVAPRNHRVKVGDLSPREMSEIGRLLPLIARSVIRAVLPDIPHAEADYNIVQNNADSRTLGPGAAQVVPHVHFHVVPRPPLDYRPPSPNTLRKLQARNQPSRPTHRTRNFSSPTVNHKPPISKTTCSDSSSKAEEIKSKYPPNKMPTGAKKSYIQFGRGMRNELDDDDAVGLVEEMRRCIAEEWNREFGGRQNNSENRALTGSSRDRGGKSPEKL